jgi:DHA1 family bicyclomycin/chloramphenicol resistance-like MFS transporter
VPARRRVGPVILGSLAALAPLSIDLYLPALPQLGDDLHASTSAVQLTLTACLLGLGIGQLVAGPLADTVGRRPPLLVGLAGFVVSSALCALAPNVAVLCLLRFLQGATGSAGLVIGRAVVRDVYGPAATRMFALLLLVTGVAPVVAPLIGAQALRVTDWRGMFVVLAGLGAILLAATAGGLRESLAPEERRPGGLRETATSLRQLAADRLFMAHVGAFALAFGALFGYIAASPFVLEDLHGVSPQLFSVIFAANAACLIVAAQVVGHLADRVAPARLMGLGIGLLAVGAVILVVAAAAGGLALLLTGTVAVSVANGIVVPTATALAMAGHGAVAGAASAILGLTQFAVAAVVAPLVGVAGDDTALPMALVIAACAAGTLLAGRVASSALPPAPSAS